MEMRDQSLSGTTRRQKSAISTPHFQPVSPGWSAEGDFPLHALIAQQVERPPCKRLVRGSIPREGSSRHSSMVERVPSKHSDRGSSPRVGSKYAGRSGRLQRDLPTGRVLDSRSSRSIFADQPDALSSSGQAMPERHESRSRVFYWWPYHECGARPARGLTSPSGMRTGGHQLKHLATSTLTPFKPGRMDRKPLYGMPWGPVGVLGRRPMRTVIGVLDVECFVGGSEVVAKAATWVGSQWSA